MFRHLGSVAGVNAGSSAMPGYRLFLMNSSSGHIDQVREIFAADDVAAISTAEQSRDDAPMELWFESRKLRRWEPVAEEG